MNPQRVYIAGPISGYEIEGPDPYAERRAVWERAKAAVRAKGFEPVSPWDLHPTGVTWEEALRADLAGLLTCQGIYLLRGYAASRGAQLELHVARQLGFFELYEDHEETILEEADRIVSGDRGPQYGRPTANFTHTAALWTAYLRERYPGIEFTPEDVAAFMILLKMAREFHREKRDNRVDIAGYAKCWDIVAEDRAKGRLMP